MLRPLLAHERLHSSVDRAPRGGSRRHWVALALVRNGEVSGHGRVRRSKLDHSCRTLREFYSSS